MPPTTSNKRSRRAAFDDDAGVEDDGVIIAEATSSLRSDTSQRKKVRVSAPGRNKSSSWSRREKSEDTSDEDEEMQEPVRDLEAGLPPASQYEIMRDAGFKHLENAEEDDQRATQRLRSRPQLIGDNHAALNAVIESIEVFNFMCHERLRVDFGPLLNFVVGENGSGKSAILTAITLCLGGKASSTNRGAALRSFVKEGQTHARLVVKIKNQGPDAFKHDLYGDSISVERQFNTAGSSGFKLKSTGDRIISTKKSDVEDVVEYYCLQVDNPLNVLSQDNARAFLNSATPTMKYRYFLMGTQLQQLDDDLKLFQARIDDCENKVAGYEETINYLEEQNAKAQKLKEVASKNNEMRAKARVYNRQLAWAQVADQEIILQEKENAIVAADEDILRMKRVVQEKTNALTEHDDMYLAAKDAAEALRQEGPHLTERKEEAQEVYDKAKSSLQEMHIQEREVHEQLKQAKDTVKGCEASIQEEKQRLEAANGGAVAKSQRDLEVAREAAKLAEEKNNDHPTSQKQLADEFEAAEKQVQQAGGDIEQKRREINVVEARIRTLSQKHQDPLAAYDPKMPQLLKLIQADREFRQKPIGPLGLHIQLMKPEWSSTLEKMLGASLDAFIVSDPVDQRRLFKYLDRLKMPHPQIYISRPGLTLNNLREPDQSFDTALRVLKFDDERVRNQLIIANSIEQLLLVPTLTEGNRIMIDGQPPVNTKVCLVHHPDERRKRGHGLLLSNKHGNLQSTPVDSYAGRPRMKADSDLEANLQKDIRAQLQSELRDLESSRRQLQQTAHKCSLAITQHKKQAKVLDREWRDASIAVEDAQRELEKYDGADLRLQGLSEDLQEARGQKEHYGEQYGVLRMEKNALNEAASAAKAALNEAKTNYVDFDARVAKAEDKVKRFEALRRTVLVEKNDAHDNVDSAEEVKRRAERSRQAQQETVEEYVADASRVVPERVHLPEGESYHSIERKYSTIVDQLKKFEKQVGKTQDQINAEAEETLQKYDAAHKAQQNLLSLNHELKQSLTRRLKKWRDLQRMISASARTNFQYLLSERGFRGRLLLDHKAKRLAVEVEPDETRENVSGRNTKTLSGGEKSFSSICLLLAIWDAMGSPLRCLDEFDVFMDVVNRGISTKMLIQAARRSVGKQFILITPNKIEHNTRGDKDVKIIRLLDPRQTRLTDPR
ncbi:P-loop containing nucleoside triphosphate hydrolase protein [Xylariales sp. AK1849]|nr:P-loop containing nucleoside triphosphate hydrolase protein [Xylariales sp. AK1849]